MKADFSCVYCGKKVQYDKKRKKLTCSNPKCPEGKSSYGWNPLQGCVWVKTSENEWQSVSKDYVVAHIHDFLL